VDTSGNTNINGKLTLSTQNKPIILAIMVGNYRGPIIDLSGRPFSGSIYMCKIVRNGKNLPQIGVRKGNWWIQSGIWDTWASCTLEFTPLINYTIMSNPSIDQIINNTLVPNTRNTIEWLNDVYVNVSDVSYIVFDRNGNATVKVPASNLQ
jgi:hypothetical protein